MRLLDMQPVGSDLAVKWEDGVEQFISLQSLRHACPCAACAGEMDIMGNVSKGPVTEFKPASYQVKQLVPVGGYAVQIHWQDGHGTGLYTHESLRNLLDQD